MMVGTLFPVKYVTYGLLTDGSQVAVLTVAHAAH